MVDTVVKGFTHNWKNSIEIDTKGGLDPVADLAAASFASLAAFITGITPTPGDVIDSSIYFIDEDNSNSEVTGHARTWAVTGNVLQGDAACDFLQKLEDEDATGDGAKTLVRFTKANGTVKVYQCTIENIVTVGGNGNAKSTMTFTIAANGVANINPTTTSTNG